MQTQNGTRWHPIREAALLSGLSESTLRYYEQIGIIPRVMRDPGSGHRVYSDRDIDLLQTVSCLNAVGMPLDSIRRYMAAVRDINGDEEDTSDAAAIRTLAATQAELLEAQDARLSGQIERIRIQQAYCRLKIRYWNLRAEGRGEEALRLLDGNRDLIDRVRRTRRGEEHDDSSEAGERTIR